MTILWDDIDLEAAGWYDPPEQGDPGDENEHENLSVRVWDRKVAAIVRWAEWRDERRAAAAVAGEGEG